MSTMASFGHKMGERGIFGRRLGLRCRLVR